MQSTAPAGTMLIRSAKVGADAPGGALIGPLNHDCHPAPDGPDDTHSPNWGNNTTWTGILAPGLSKRCIWDALQSRRVYSSHDRNCRLWFRVDGAAMGSIAEDGDADDTIAKLEVLEDGVVVNTTGPLASTCRWMVAWRPEPGPHYYFVKLTQADGNVLWSAPVWVKVGGE